MQEGVLAVEWPDRLARPVAGAIVVVFTIVDDTTRDIRIGDGGSVVTDPGEKLTDARRPRTMREDHPVPPARMIAPRPPDEATRLAVLREYDVLDTPPEQPLDDLTALAAYICRTPISLITLVDDERQWFKSTFGFEARETSRDVSFCAHGLTATTPFVVPDTTKDDRFADNPFVTGGPRCASMPRRRSARPRARPWARSASSTRCRASSTRPRSARSTRSAAR